MKTAFLKNFVRVRVLAGLALAGALTLKPASAQDSAAPTGYFSPMPAGILPGSPLAQVVKLAKAGVDEGLIQAYVTNSASTFNLDTDKIIYLKDAGVPNDLVTEMMQHDTALQSQMATVSAPPPAATPPDIAPPVPVDSTVPPDIGNPAPPPLVGDDAQPPDGTAPPDGPVTLNNFYDSLAPYGNWVQVDGYGRCWQPGVGNYNPDWQPYGDHGHWVYTDSGWYWASDYEWGWAPFHYGRWFHREHLGWCWSPDTVWGPSWVTWRYSNDYCGWAPLPPGSYYQAGIGFMYNGSAVGANFDFGLTPDSFVFVGTGDFYNPHPFRHRIDHGLAAQIYHQTAAVNGLSHDGRSFINHGIDPARISQVTHTTIQPVPLRTVAGGMGRVLPNETVSRPSGAGYASHSQSGSGYLRIANGGYYVAPPTPHYNYNQAVPAPRPYAPMMYSPRQEPQPPPVPEQYRPEPQPTPEERPQPAAPVRYYAPPAPTASKPNTSTDQKNPPH